MLQHISGKAIGKIVLDKLKKVCYADSGTGRGGAAICSHILVPGSFFVLVSVYRVDELLFNALQRFNMGHGAKVLIRGLNNEGYGIIGGVVFSNRQYRYSLLTQGCDSVFW